MKIGLKLWSSNAGNYLEEARRLHAQKAFDYIELYVVPGTLDALPLWKTLPIPFMLHAPHFTHGMNLAVAEHWQHNSGLFAQVKTYGNALGAPETVVHGGTYGDISETARQLSRICSEYGFNPKDIYLENKPLTVFKDGVHHPSRGASPEEIIQARELAGVSFCLDAAHALCSANALGIEPYSYIQRFAALGPGLFHLNDELGTVTQDEHRHIGEGSLDFSRIFNIIGKDIKAAIETIKDSPSRLDDFAEDSARLRCFL